MLTEIKTLLQRWGDAPVHSIAISLFQSKDQIQFLDEIGYEHNPYTHCPKNDGAWRRGKCDCDIKQSFGAPTHSTLPAVPALTFVWLGFARRLQRLLMHAPMGSDTVRTRRWHH